MVEKIACGALADAVLNICIQDRISISLSTAVSKHNQFLQNPREAIWTAVNLI